MCGRFAKSETISAAAVRWSAFIANALADWQPSDEIRSAQLVPVLLEIVSRP